MTIISTSSQLIINYSLFILSFDVIWQWFPTRNLGPSASSGLLRRGSDFILNASLIHTTSDHVLLPQTVTVSFFIFCHYYFHYTIWMSLVTDLIFLVLLLNQRWSPPLRLQASHCSTFRIFIIIIIIIIIYVLVLKVWWNTAGINKKREHKTWCFPEDGYRNCQLISFSDMVQSYPLSERSEQQMCFHGQLWSARTVQLSIPSCTTMGALERSRKRILILER